MLGGDHYFWEMLQMKQVAVLVDLAFVLYALYRPLGRRQATAQEVHDFANACILAGEELFRIYCYHCPPFGGTERHPITRLPVHFNATPTYHGMTQLISDLEVMDRVAFRAGELSFNGWVIKKQAAQQIAQTGRGVVAADFEPDMKQKRVDMKIGLDVAWLASKGIVNRIILATGDSDFVPAMKFARREGVQVVLVHLNQRIKRDMLTHADEVRRVQFPPAAIAAQLAALGP